MECTAMKPPSRRQRTITNRRPRSPIERPAASLLTMDPDLERRLAALLKLPEADRAVLAHALIDSLATGVDPDVDAAWAAEIARRIRDLEDGRTKGIPWEEARRIIRGG